MFSTGEKIVLIKYSGKYIEIYFNLKNILFKNFVDTWYVCARAQPAIKGEGLAFLSKAETTS